MTEKELPFCCESGHWAIYDTAKRLKEIRKHGFSSLPRRAVCTTCGRVLLIDPGKPDEEFQKRKQNQKQWRNQNREDKKRENQKDF